jgi:hypothetical protein
MSSRPEPGAAWRDRVIATAVLVGVLAVFFAPALLGPDQFVFRDNGRMHWPVKQYVAEQLQAGHFPEWNPYGGLGIPLVAGSVDALLHPFNLLLVALPFPVAFKGWVLLSYVLAATGGFAWGRALGRSTPAAIAAALGFALSGALVGSSDNVQYLTTLAALPWVFTAAHRWLADGGRGRLALIGIASATCAAAGDPQAWGFAIALLPAYSAAIMPDAAGRLPMRIGRGPAATGAAIVGAAPVVLPVLAWMPESSRGGSLSTFELERWALPLPRVLELVLPHMYRDAPGLLASPVYMAYGGGATTQIPWVISVYLGASVVALAAVGAARAPAARWLLAAAALFTWMALGHHAGFGQLLPHLPILSGFRYWEKMAIWPSLLVPMAAAFGLDAFATGLAGARAALAIAAAGAVALALGAAGHFAPDGLQHLLARTTVAPATTEAFSDNLLEGLRHAGTVCVLLGLVAVAIRRGWVRRSPAALLALVVVFDMFAANVRGYLLANSAIVEQRSSFADFLRNEPGLQRVLTPFELTPDRWPALRQFEAGWLWGGHMLEPAFNIAARVGNFDPYTGMVPSRIHRFQLRVPLEERLPRVGLFGVAFVPVPLRPEMAAAARLAPPYEVAASDPRLPAHLLRVPHRPRAYVAPEVRHVDRRGAMEFVISAEAMASQVSVVEAPLPKGYAPGGGSARIVSDAPERVVLETSSDQPALLVLNGTYASGWSARVDGRGAGIVPANYLARGVWVPAGSHRVEFDYRTPWLREGWAVLAIAAAALGAAELVARGRLRRRAP